MVENGVTAKLAVFRAGLAAELILAPVTGMMSKVWYRKLVFVGTMGKCVCQKRLRVGWCLVDETGVYATIY